MNIEFKAAQNGDIEYFKDNINSKVSWLSSSYSKSGDTVVHFAARCNHLPLLEYFVTEGAQLETVNLDGKRPLHEAAQYSSKECLTYLLKCGIKVDPLKRADWTPLMLACTKDDLEIIQCLIASGADPSLRNKDGWNSFHIAIREGHLPIIQYLLSYGTRLWDTVSKNGRTPLHTAALHGHCEVTDYLLDHCEYLPDIQDSCGSTPLMDALRVQSISTAKLLISKHKADVRKEDNLGRQALHLSAQSGATESVRYLVESCDISPNSLSTLTHLTGLQCAAKEGHHEVIKLLLSLGAQVDACDNKGRTALHIASGAQHAACVAVLLQHGASCKQDSFGTQPQQLARKHEVIEVFLQNDIT